MATKEFKAWGEAQHETLERLWRHGSVAALIEAFIICSRCSIPLPRWTSKGILTVLDESVRGNLKGRLGRHSIWLTQYRQDMIDFRRYETILELREHGVKWKSVYQSAADFLEGTDAAGKEDTMRVAYKRYKKRERAAPWRYHTFSYYKPLQAKEMPMTADYLKLFEDVERFD